MNKKLYNLMDWAAIEEIVYGEAVHPEIILGAHMVSKNSLVQAFFPGAVKVSVKLNEPKLVGTKEVYEFPMEEADEAGFYACLIPGSVKSGYSYTVEYINEKTNKPIKKEIHEAYNGTHVLTEETAESINSGACYKCFKYLGAHLMTDNDIDGCGFAIWAPNALRVSVVGDFNNWNGLTHQMMAIGNTGIFELFIPDVSEGDNYKFEILIKGFEKVTKCDPYAFSVDGENLFNSVVTKLNNFTWQDGDWLYKRKSFDFKSNALNIYELNINSYMKYKGFTNIKKATKNIVSYVKKMGYSHVELMPLFEYFDDNCAGFNTSCFYAPTYRFGKPSDYMYFINEMHKASIGVIMDWTVNSFDNSQMSFGAFDGTCLYEHEDPRKGIDARTGMYLFNYLRPEVTEYLISNANFWADFYHVDGFKFVETTSMLYLDYYRQDGNWIPNIYGSNENLEAIDFIKKCNKQIHGRKDGIITISDDRSGFDNMTYSSGMSENAKGDCLGFDLTVNSGFNSNVIEYMSLDPIMRSNNHNDVTIGSIYQYKENFCFSISHNDTEFGKGGLINRMPGCNEDKMANLRALYGYMMTNPGKKIMFMGQDFADYHSFDCNMELDFGLLLNEENLKFNNYVACINRFYKENPALYQLDYETTGFEWLNNMAADDNVISFVRYGKTKNDFLVCILNFANKAYEKYKIGVPVKGKYVEVFNSDDEDFGGHGISNIRNILSRKDKYDGRDESIRVKLAPLSLTILKFKALTTRELSEISKREAFKEERKLQREAEKNAVIKERENRRKALLRERSKIKNSVKNDLNNKILMAEKAISEGSENIKNKSLNKKVNRK